jgi:hypothetical protein
MKVTLTVPYGRMAAGHRYTVIEEGRDYYLFSNGHYVFKHLCDTRPPENAAPQEEFEIDYDDWR